MTPQDIAERLKAEAARRGFALSGIAPATDADGFGRFCDWLDRGYHGEMDYLDRHREHRRHPRAVLEPVRSVLMLAFEYAAESPSELPANHGRVAAFARGPDYHRLLWDQLNGLSAWLAEAVPGAVSHGVADSAPLLERDFARRAGLGWIGKNTLLINKHRGSFFFLAGLLTSLELPADPPHVADHCGTCSACLDACPTGAFPEPGTLDARRCISYLTIETKTPFANDLRTPVGDWLFGCDVCQDVCPWNRRAGTRTPAFPTDPRLATVDAVELLTLTAAEFRQRYRSTVLSRPRLAGLKRNAAIVLGNTGTVDVLPALEAALSDPNEVVREAAAWAIERIRSRHPDG